MLSCHQNNIFLLIFARGIEDSIEYFILQSNILALARNIYKSIHVNA